MLHKLKKFFLKKKKSIDPLTNLPDREQLLIDINSKNQILFLLNIDGFKEINDFYGNEFGNSILKQIAIEINTLLENILYKKNKFQLYKLPIDEYGILFCKNISKEEILFIAKSLNENFEKKTFGKDGFSFYISISIGISSLNESDQISNKLLANTNLALKQAKEEKVDFIIFDKMSEKYREYEDNIKWTKKIKEAISENRIISYYQPIQNIKTGKIEKFESLIRLITENGEVISPSKFLEISKKNRLYHQLTKIVIQNSFSKINDNPDIEISINLSTQDIMNHDIRHYIFEQIKKCLYPDKIVFEILESEGINNFNSCIDFINIVKSFGVKIAIDDFGTGYSNFEYILKLNVDYLKIDGSLIRNILTDKNSRIIIETIISFCNKMNIKTIAEFVSSKEIFDELNNIGIDFVQGYYIGKPESDIIFP